ncbi:Uncharacterized protein dnm_079690 [Desulfonema magnum]|uniref:Uncharacterized protein n=1 Tax=Desulfonema magnum TaxID=45655 RepID=A0A975BFF7_9BACT|nr:Uncharacterized protein dnm_001980 [Desulfonema magnum]QTA85251.1 Uncharacterized protein dnm_012560 [Desulfonema magnum]QTA85702.1 Uncharacterized protein dnm_017160 [Desulfonema magnum]QTA86082.1 Uncharacterized protein dnm_021000 [Desulfonema magnum]QTA86165.1 Uncharacterized protein dnm_021860 [Desulfonema magnum]
MAYDGLRDILYKYTVRKYMSEPLTALIPGADIIRRFLL